MEAARCQRCHGAAARTMEDVQTPKMPRGCGTPEMPRDGGAKVVPTPASDDASAMPVAAGSSRAEQFRNSHRGTLSDFTVPVTGKASDDACAMPVAAGSSRVEQFRNSHMGTLSDFTAPVTGKSSVYRVSFISRLRFREQELSFDLGL
jgi:hypothetical protein